MGTVIEAANKVFMVVSYMILLLLLASFCIVTVSFENLIALFISHVLHTTLYNYRICEHSSVGRVLQTSIWIPHSFRLSGEFLATRLFDRKK